MRTQSLHKRFKQSIIIKCQSIIYKAISKTRHTNMIPLASGIIQSPVPTTDASVQIDHRRPACLQGGSAQPGKVQSCPHLLSAEPKFHHRAYIYHRKKKPLTIVNQLVSDYTAEVTSGLQNNITHYLQIDIILL